MLLSKAVSTVKIFVSPVTDLARESDISELLVRLRGLPGCLSYGLAHSHDNNELWVLSSHWESQECMQRYFFEKDLADLIQVLVKYCREMHFSTSFSESDTSHDI